MLRATILAGKASDSASQGCQSHIDLLCEFRVGGQRVGLSPLSSIGTTGDNRHVQVQLVQQNVAMTWFSSYKSPGIAATMAERTEA